MGILIFHRVQIPPQGGLSAHGIHQGDLHTGQLDVGGYKVNALRVVQNALAGGDGLLVQHLSHHVREGDGQAVRLGISQADGKTGLGVAIHD